MSRKESEFHYQGDITEEPGKMQGALLFKCSEVGAVQWQM